jgi:hypothetical protein
MRSVFGFNLLLFEYMGYVTIGFGMSGSWTLILEIEFDHLGTYIYLMKSLSQNLVASTPVLHSVIYIFLHSAACCPVRQS